ncbi:MAG TPA: nitroreductase family protein [Fusibacter sp.]|nr:nitroreductase family protein [Fusibacter sp.]
MNPVIEVIKNRKSVRQYEDRIVPSDIKEAILQAAFRAPTAGNQMLYTIIDVTDQALKERLAQTCDDQPFIAKAPLVLIFLADTRRWLDAYEEAGLEARQPGLGDLFLAMQDAIIAAQNAVIAAESFGLGSCYIGDILENVEIHRDLLGLDPYTVPITMLVIGYPTESQTTRTQPNRFDREYIVFENQYRRLSGEELRDMHQKQTSKPDYDFDADINAFGTRKYMSDFALEMTRSAEVYAKAFMK